MPDFDAERVVAQLAQRILEDLADRTEIRRADARLRIAGLTQEGDASAVTVLFESPGGIRESTVPVALNQASSLAWGAYILANDLQDEVIELLGQARPHCGDHSHPMVVRTNEAGTWWECPLDGSIRRLIEPLNA